MFRGISFTAAALVLTCLSAGAQSADEPSIAVVDGLSMGDFLNIRATPSAIGSIEARLPNGAGVRNFGCAQYSGYEWCKVTTLTAPQVSGWTPERYLRTASKAEEEALKETAAPSIGAASPGTETAPTWAGRMAKSEAEPADMPGNLDARIGTGSEGSAGKADAEKLREAIIARYGPLYRSALSQPTIGETGNAAPGIDETAPAAGDAASGTAAAAEADPAPDDGTDAQGIPHPTPRPDKPGEKLASVEAAEKTTGEIPCADAFGQPTRACQASITRLGPGIADVVVALPDGGSRTIRFRGGKPDTSDSPEPVQTTREGSLNMIRIGKAERFEILDAVALGK
jgi:hypothetical protein